MKPLTKLQEVEKELKHKMIDRIWFLIRRFEKKHNITTRVNVTVESLKKIDKKVKK